MVSEIDLGSSYGALVIMISGKFFELNTLLLFYFTFGNIFSIYLFDFMNHSVFYGIGNIMVLKIVYIR